uniref:YqgF/RNase H-like domain-containing protein n=1 Tax=Rhodosorus marinus TaxID=101924 RepID=A0A7S2ZDN2_9RHOD|mmetsp:Transcript_15486/g.63171  ORF Transcript_15486/g.63171 Transcript_15486/m.63171 type:complete len:157 (+) Transcript_15486:190-660(+)
MLNFLSAVCCIGGSDGKVHLGKKTLAVDYGLRRVGLALSVGIAPRRLNKIYNRGNLGEVARRISDVARREMVLQVVVGLPLNSKGTSYLVLETRGRCTNKSVAAKTENASELLPQVMRASKLQLPENSANTLESLSQNRPFTSGTNGSPHKLHGTD